MYELKHDVAFSFFDGKCFICQKRYGRGFTFHHRDYIMGEKTYRDFKNTIKYNIYVLPIVIKKPDRFFLLCTPCHTTITKLKRRLKANFIRLLIVYWLTE